MKKLSLISTTLFIGILLLSSCKKDEENPIQKALPVLTTDAVTLITSTSATSGGNISNDGGSTVSALGVCWSTSSGPTISLSTKTNDRGSSGNNGPFQSFITGLTENTTYYVKAYATNEAGTSYGNEVSFTTSATGVPTITTLAVTSITATSAFSGGTITSDGNSTVTDRGVVWSTSVNPTIALSTKTSDGTGTGSFVSYMYGTSNTTYYVRAYATNATGTGYGNEISFKTKLAIGDSFQGGIIAYFLQAGDPGYDSNVAHGIIAASIDQSTSAPWALTLTVTGATSQAIGSGQANTNTIVTNQGAGSYAAKLCDELVIGSYSDWYLPSMYELEKLYLNKDKIGGFAVAFYWGSSEENMNTAWAQSFNSNSQTAGTKTSPYNVRAVRSF